MRKRNSILENKKLGKSLQDFYALLPRCYWSKATRKQSAYVLVKCGDCSNQVKIYYDKTIEKKPFNKALDNLIEIGGVLADKIWWKELFKEIGIIE
jgi:hypothetical protein